MQESASRAKLQRKLFDRDWWAHTNEYTILKTISGLQVLEKGANNKTLLMAAARDGSLRSLRKVIELGAEINERDDNGWTALNWAIFSDEEAIEKTVLLISTGANIHSIDNNKRTILSYAKSADSVRGTKAYWQLLEGPEAKPRSIKDTLTSMLEVVSHSFSDMVGFFPSRPPSHEEIALLFDEKSDPVIVKRKSIEALNKTEKGRIIGAKLETLKLVAIRTHDLANYSLLRDFPGTIDEDKLIKFVRRFLDERLKYDSPMFGAFAARPPRGYGDRKKTYEIYAEMDHNKRSAADGIVDRCRVRIEPQNSGEEVSVDFNSDIGSFVSLADEDLIFAWHGERNAKNSPPIISRSNMKINPKSFELRRLVYARLAEKFALSMYSSVLSVPVEDVSIGQLAKNDDRWLSFDIWAERPIDVKNVTVYRKNTRQNFIPKFKRYTGKEVVIAAFATLVGNHGVIRQTFLGEVTESDLDLSRAAVARQFPLTDTLKVRFDDQYIPAWAFDYSFGKINYSVLLEAYLLFADRAESILAAAIAAGKVDTVGTYFSLKPDQLRVVDAFSKVCRESSYTKRTIILFAISGFTSECLSDGDPEWFIRFFRKLFRMEKLSGASVGALFCPEFSESSTGGLVDPLEAVETFFNLLEISAKSIKKSGLVFDAFHTQNPNILFGRLRNGKKVTIYAYCGGRTQSGAPCDTFPLIIGKNVNCPECAKLICHECGFCATNCSRTNAT